MKVQYRFTFLIIFLLFISAVNAQKASKATAADSLWADSVFKTLSPDERIGQLFMIRSFSNRDSAYYKDISDVIKYYKVGGLCFFKGGPLSEAQLTNRWQKLSKVPLFIAIDGEWGLGMRLDSTLSFPRQMTIGAIHNDSLIYYMGKEIARQCREEGIQINFAPVADINSNPANPVINIRSWGEDKESVARKSYLYMKGMQDNGIFTTAKHFPGHGDTDSDSHLTMPVIRHSQTTLDTLDLYPFRYLVQNGISGVMVAHLYIPALDSTPNNPSTLSYPIITGLLKNKMGFNGLVFTDALDMNGVASFFEPGKLEVKALQAGNDVLLLSQDVQTAICEIQQAIDSGKLLQKSIDERCKKILRYKYKAGLNNVKPVNTEGLYDRLNTPQAELFIRQLYERAVTLLKNDDSILPLQCLDTLRIACLTLGDTIANSFQHSLSAYAQVQHFYLPRKPDSTVAAMVMDTLETFNLVIVGLVNTNSSPGRNFGFGTETVALVNELAKRQPIILDLFAIPYSLHLFDSLPKAKAIVVSYQDNPFIHNLSAQAIFGGIPFRGKLPVMASPKYPSGSGILTTEITRLKYTMPEELQISSATLAKVDSIAEKGIAAHAYPGCQIWAAKDGKVIYNKAFGYFTYDSIRKVQPDDVYDLASVTKIAATTLAVMKLYDEHKIDLDKRLAKYLPILRRTNKKNITIREVMTHQAGLLPFIHFYPKTFKNGQLDSLLYDKTASDAFPFCVADSLYLRWDYRQKILDSIALSPLLPEKKYKYSDLGFILLGAMVEHVTGKKLEEYVMESFYRPMGLSTMGFHPLQRFSKEIIPPTEDDKIFRKQLVKGYVHDPTAAIMGGVAGHAGLFSDANDLGILMQMLLQKGNYGSIQYLDSATVKEFTRTQFAATGNRRALGFDKPLGDGTNDGPTCPQASPLSFGHTGFTGTYAWADPENGLVYIFLSNRIYPDAGNNKLAKMNIRTDIQEVFYKAIKD
ncbi:MAG: serine hydrolase [Lentimicrobiaceae bacterium]|nr:serine hydrolase [Lentimicrobiaceae bacterium]